MISKIFSSTSSVEDAAVSAHFDVSRVLRMLALFHLDSSRLCCVYCATQELKRPGLHKTFYVYYLPTHECQIIKREEEEEEKKKKKRKETKSMYILRLLDLSFSTSRFVICTISQKSCFTYCSIDTFNIYFINERGKATLSS